jgi:hypothetical protein
MTAISVTDSLTEQVSNCVPKVLSDWLTLSYMVFFGEFLTTHLVNKYQVFFQYQSVFT